MEQEQEYNETNPFAKLILVAMLLFVLYACYQPTEVKPKSVAVKPKSTVTPTLDTTLLDNADFVVRAYQTVREGGIKFRFEAVNKQSGAVLSGVSYQYTNLNTAVPININGNYFVGLNNDGGTTRANVTLSRNGVTKSREFWSNTGNHDGHSITCEDNVNSLTSSSYAVGVNSVITLTWGGTFASGQTLNWYGDENAYTELSRTDKTITIRVNQFPFWIQAQPTAVVSNNYCHGWTGIYFC